MGTKIVDKVSIIVRKSKLRVERVIRKEIVGRERSKVIICCSYICRI